MEKLLAASQLLKFKRFKEMTKSAEGIVEKAETFRGKARKPPFFELAIPIDPDAPYSPDDKVTLESEGGEYSKTLTAAEGVDGGDGYLSFRFKGLILDLRYSAKLTSRGKVISLFTRAEITGYIEGTTEERMEAPPTFHSIVEEEEVPDEQIEYEEDMPEYTEPVDIDI